MKFFRWLVKYRINLSIIALLLTASVQFAHSDRQNIGTENFPPQCGDFELSNSKFFAVPNATTAVVTGDFNNDAIPDLVFTMSNTNSIAVALGNNQSGFETARQFVAGVETQDAAVGDFNKDGELDLAVTSSGDRLVNILLGDGAGNFALTDSYQVGTAPRVVVAADLNRDGWLDLVIGNTESSNLTIYLGGGGGFTAAAQPTIGLNGRPRAFRIADFNNDQNQDIVSVAQNFSGDSFIQIFNGNGTGVFTAGLSFTVPEFYILDSADFNNDNFPDFATYGFRDSKVRVYINNQVGGFNAPIEVIASNGSFQSLVAGDLNADGNIDLATGGSFLINNGGASFTVSDNAATLGGNFVLADFNGDGLLDQASPGGLSDTVGSAQYWTFSVAYGLGNAKFGVSTFPPRLGGSSATVAADFNNDGRMDVAAASSFQNSVNVSFQNADGSFTTAANPAYSNGGTATVYPSLTVGDFNNDGIADMATILGWANSAIVLTNNGTGQFTTTSIFLSNPPFAISPQFIQPGDFNNDSRTDLVVVGGESFGILLNNGIGGFTVGTFVGVNSSGAFKTVAIGDFDGDGKQDLAITRGGLTVLIFRGVGDGTFTSAGALISPSYATVIRSSDLNGDGRSDLILLTGGFTGGNPNLTVFLANNAGGFDPTNYPVTGTPNDATVGDFNGDSIKDFLLVNSPRNFATLYVGNGSGGFTPQFSIPATNGPYSGFAADFNHDQKLDIVMAARFGGTAVFLNQSSKAPCITVNDVQVAEGNTGTTNAQFTVSLSQISAQTVSLNYSVVGRSARVNSDLTGASGALTFLPGQLTKTVDVSVNGDTLDEINETFQLVLTNPSNGSLTDAIGIGTITDDDAAPEVQVNDLSVVEGTGSNPTVMTFNATLSSPTGRKAKVNYSLISGTALIGDDFEANSGTLVFNENESVKQIAVKINADAFVEPDETFKVKLASPSNLAISDDEAIGTIQNDDVGGSVQLQAAVSEIGEAGKSITINVARTGGNAAGIIFRYATTNGTATANQDYLPSEGKLVFDAGDSVKSFIVPILDDAIDEPTIETVNLTISDISGGAVLGSQTTAVLNIIDDDPAPLLAIASTNVIETNSGTTTANFAVNLLAVSGQSVTVNFATADGTAIAPGDYQSRSGALTFAPGEISKTIAVLVNGDTQIEPDETFFINLSSPVNVVFQNSQAVGTIINDDFNTSRKPIADFDGDRKTDLSIFRASGGEWWYLRSSDSTNRAFQFGSSTDKIMPADFTGDGKTDVAFWRESSGEWFILRSEDSSFFSFPFGTAGDRPYPADFDGDGKDDPAIFRPSNATWYILNSSGGFTIRQFGVFEDIPQVSDYDGDGKADLAVFRPSVGEWWINRSIDGQSIGLQFGTSADKPVPGDYTGDGKTDVAIFRPSNGEWFVLRSEDSSFYSAPFGTATDIPVPGDYDGDAKADFAVFRPSDTNWYVSKSSGGFLIAQFGNTGDKPIPSAYVR